MGMVLRTVSSRFEELWDGGRKPATLPQLRSLNIYLRSYVQDDTERFHLVQVMFKLSVEPETTKVLNRAQVSALLKIIHSKYEQQFGAYLSSLTEGMSE